jgi:hypothetical protein
MYFESLKAWERPHHNIISVGVAYAVCFTPRTTLLLFLMWRSFLALRRLLKEVRGVPRV